MSETDFTDSHNFSINVLENNLKGATFSRYEALALLGASTLSWWIEIVFNVFGQLMSVRRIGDATLQRVANSDASACLDVVIPNE